jgi:hypothetical protein
MIGPTGAVRVMVATRPVDFRKGAEGLAALVRELWRRRHTPAHHGQFAVGTSMADHRSQVVGKHARHGRQVAGAILGHFNRSRIAA